MRIGRAIQVQRNDTYAAGLPIQEPAERALLYKALEQGPVAIALVSRDGLFVYVNRRFCEITGYGPDEVLGKHTRMMKSGDMDADEYRALWNTVLNGEEWFGEFHNRKKNGERYWEKASISPIRNPQGDIEYFVKISLDFTRERELEGDLRSQYVLFSQITENMSDVVAMLDADGRYRYVTPSSRRALGYAPEELIGKSVFDFIDSAQKEGHVKAFQAAYAGRQGQIESRFLHKDGHYIHLETATQALSDKDGESRGMLIASRDISKRKQVEAELVRANKELKEREDRLKNSLQRMHEATDQLQEERKRYERLVRATNGFVYSVDLQDGAVVNAVNLPGCEQVTGYTAEEYARDPDLWRNRIYPEDAGAILNQVVELTAGAPVVVIEHRIYHRDGGVRWLKNTSVARRNDDGRLVGYDGLITDITDFKHAESERDKLTRELRDMALRDSLTRLTNRRGFEDELNRLWDLSLRHRFPLGLMVVDIDHFKTLNDSHGHIVGDQVLMECANLIRASVRDSDVVCRFGGDEITVILPWSERAETRRVAERVLQALRAHTFCRGMHDLRTTISIGTATVTASSGDSADRFLSRADKALYRAKQFGRNQICVAEELTTSVGGHPRTDAVSDREKADSSGMVLVIDDDPAICTLVKRILVGEGFDVITTGAVQDAIAALQSERGQFDAALVDLNLGVESGLDLLEQMKQIDSTVVPIVITGEVSAENAIRSLRYGAYDLLRKPLARAPIIAAVQRAVEYRRLLLENRRYQMHLEDMVREKSTAHSDALEKLRESFQFTLEAMATMLDAREKKTGEHSKRVAAMAKVLAREMGVSGAEARTIEIGALLHDIGKIAVPDSILLKPGPLDDEERKIMRRHPRIGYDIIRRSPALQDASEIVLSHQEHYDGDGYPRGLKGEEICLGARIFAVVDAYDAMRAERPYAKSLSREKACEEIQRHRGTQFDPAVVDAFARCLDEIETIGNWPAVS